MSIYQGINKLPLSKFIECLVDGNIAALIIQGLPSSEQDDLLLTTTWQDILQQYTAAIGNHEYKVYLSVYRELSALNHEVQCVQSLLELMRSIQCLILIKNYDVPPEVFNAQTQTGILLNQIAKTTCRFNNRDTKTYEAELKKIHNRTAALRIKRDLKKITLEGLKSNKGEGGTMDRRYFDSILITISDHAGYEIKEDITVSKFCERIKRYNDYCENLKNSKR